MEIRGYRPADRSRLYEICLRTGADGGDATGRHADPDLAGHIFVGPYLEISPEFAFVLDPGDGTPVGYVLGVADTAWFEHECEQRWWPALRHRYPDPGPERPGQPLTPDQRLAALIHHPPVTPLELRELLADYPSHLHIDLLPEAQGRGNGRRLMSRLFTALAAAGSTGVHLGVSAGNPNAIGFYRRLGFTEVESSPGGLTMARSLG